MTVSRSLGTVTRFPMALTGNWTHVNRLAADRLAPKVLASVMLDGGSIASVVLAGARRRPAHVMLRYSVHKELGSRLCASYPYTSHHTSADCCSLLRLPGLARQLRCGRRPHACSFTHPRPQGGGCSTDLDDSVVRLDSLMPPRGHVKSSCVRLSRRFRPLGLSRSSGALRGLYNAPQGACLPPFGGDLKAVLARSIADAGCSPTSATIHPAVGRVCYRGLRSSAPPQGALGVESHC